MTRRAAGEGTVYRRQDGRWVASLSFGRRGSRTTWTRYAATQADARRKLKQLVAQRDVGLMADPAKVTVGDYLAFWLAEVAARRVTAATLRSYEQNVRLHITPAVGKVRLADLSPIHVRRMVNAMLDAGYAPATAGLCRDVLAFALADAVNDDLLARNAAKRVPRPQTPASDTPTVTADQARQALAAAGDRWQAGFAVGMSLGLRAGELLGLSWDDVDLDAATVRLGSQLKREAGRWVLAPTKTRTARTLPLPQFAVDALRDRRHQQRLEQMVAARWTGNPLGLVLTTYTGAPHHQNNLYREARRVCEQVGLPPMGPHRLFRHGCASLLAAMGVHPRVSMELLRHASIEVNQGVYTHVVESQLRQAADLLGAALSHTDVV